MIFVHTCMLHCAVETDFLRDSTALRRLLSCNIQVGGDLFLFLLLTLVSQNIFQLQTTCVGLNNMGTSDSVCGEGAK